MSQLPKYSAQIQIFLIIVLGAIILLPGTGQIPLIDRDEPRFAQATVEMIERGDWVIPYFNGEYRFDKPVLTYWLMRIGYGIFGISELGARIHSVVSTIMIGLVIWWAGRRWFSSITGLAASIGFLTCLQIIVNGRSCIADMPMVLAVALSQVALCELLRRETTENPLLWRLILYISLGLGFLAKGPIAMIVPLLSALLFRFVFWRKPLPWRNLGLAYGLPLTIIIIAAWGVPALLRTQGEFWNVGINKHVVNRGVNIFHGRFYFPFYYLGTIFISLFPWAAFAGRGWPVLRKRWSVENAFLVSWLITPYIIFSFYATQLPHYVMPGFAAFFLILAQSFDKPVEIKTWMKWLSWVVVALPGLVVIVLLGFMLFVPITAPYTDIRFCLWGAAGLLSGLIIMAFLYAYNKKKWLWIGIIIIALSVSSIGTGFRRMSLGVQMVPIFKSMPRDTGYLGFRFMEGSLIFYSDAKWQGTDDIQKVNQFLQSPGPRLVVMLEKEQKLDHYLNWKWSQWRGEAKPLKTTEYIEELDSIDTRGYSLKKIQGLNLGRYTWVNLRIYYKSEF